MTSDDYDDDKAAFDVAYQKAQREAFENKWPVDRPQVVIVGGQTGAGKSTVDENVKEIFRNGNYITLDTDRFRDLHPQIGEIRGQDDKGYVQRTGLFASTCYGANISAGVESNIFAVGR